MNAFTYATEVWGRSLLSSKRRVSLLDDSGNVSAHARPGFSDTFNHKRTLDGFLLHQLKPAETNLCVLTFVTYIKDLEVLLRHGGGGGSGFEISLWVDKICFPSCSNS